MLGRNQMPLSKEEKKLERHQEATSLPAYEQLRHVQPGGPSSHFEEEEEKKYASDNGTPYTSMMMACCVRPVRHQKMHALLTLYKAWKAAGYDLSVLRTCETL